eukprot:4027091-Pleurochrysis_carterae.AAC.3
MVALAMRSHSVHRTSSSPISHLESRVAYARRPQTGSLRRMHRPTPPCYTRHKQTSGDSKQLRAASSPTPGTRACGASRAAPLRRTGRRARRWACECPWPSPPENEPDGEAWARAAESEGGFSRNSLAAEPRAGSEFFRINLEYSSSLTNEYRMIPHVTRL